MNARRIDRIAGRFDVRSDVWLVDVELLRLFDENLCKVAIDAPIALLIRVCECGTGHACPKSEVVSFAIMR